MRYSTRGRIRFRFIWLATGLAFVALAVLLGPWMYGRWQFQQMMVYEDFRFSGTVVDEGGKPIDGVTVRVVAGRRKKMGFETNYDSSYIRDVNGSFDIERDGYSSVSLQFIKRGYEVDKLQFSDGGFHRGLRVVLRAEGSTTRSTMGGPQ